MSGNGKVTREEIGTEVKVSEEIDHRKKARKGPLYRLWKEHDGLDEDMQHKSTIGQYLNVVRMGANSRTSCAKLGIGTATYDRWMMRGMEGDGVDYVRFYRAVSEAMADAYGHMEGKLAGKDPLKWLQMSRTAREVGEGEYRDEVARKVERVDDKRLSVDAESLQEVLKTLQDAGVDLQHTVEFDPNDIVDADYDEVEDGEFISSKSDPHTLSHIPNNMRLNLTHSDTPMSLPDDTKMSHDNNMSADNSMSQEGYPHEDSPYLNTQNSVASSSTNSVGPASQLNTKGNGSHPSQPNTRNGRSPNGSVTSNGTSTSDITNRLNALRNRINGND